MTKYDAKVLLDEAAEDTEWDDTDVSAVYAAIYGHAPSQTADVGDTLSLCYAWLASSEARAISIDSKKEEE